jgi:hydroxymethylbilane synthase
MLALTLKNMATAAKRRLILGTRGSRLALWQAGYVKKQLEEEYGDLVVTIKVIKTTGDKIKKTPLNKVGGKALFLKEIEDQLLAGKVHVGVHSMKDVPNLLPKGLAIAAILKREDPRDVFVSKKFDSLLQLPKKAKVGTSSLRRQAQLKNFRPDLEVVPLRGNVETRIRKMAGGNPPAVILAAAGLTRLGMASKITEYLPTTLMLPAVGQGAIGLEVRENDLDTRRLIDFMNDIATVQCLQAERAFSRALEGDCQAPIGAYAEINGQELRLTGMVASPDGRELIRDRIEGNIRDAAAVGEQLAKSLFGQGAREILRSCRGK